HQDILLNIAELFRLYQRVTQRGKTMIAPRDILIRRRPLRTRQPDVLFISKERHTQNSPVTSSAPLDTAPELVVEILSPSDTRALLAGKIADYQKVNVLECWVVNVDLRTVEILRLSETAVESVLIYGEMETA